MISFFAQIRAETGIFPAGEKPIVLLRGYIESLNGRGGTAPAAAKHALSVWPGALGVDCPLSNGMIAAAVSVGANEPPIQAPDRPVSTVRAIEGVANNVGVVPRNRAFAAGVFF